MRHMIKLEATFDVNSNAAVDDLAILLAKNPGASVYLRHAIAQAIAETVKEYTGRTWYFSVAVAKIAPFEVPGIKEHKPRKMRQVVTR